MENHRARYRKRYEEAMTSAAEQYLQGLHERGMDAHPTLTRAAAERAHREYVTHAEQDAFEELKHNVEHHRHVLKEGLKIGWLRKLLFPAMCVLWSVLAYLSFQHPGWFVPGASRLFVGAAIVCALFSFIGILQP